MSYRLSATVYTSYAAGAAAVGILSNPTALRFSYGPHGCDACTVRYRVPQNTALQIVSGGAFFHLVVSAHGSTQWSGRVESASIVADGVELIAYGYWRALLDQSYTTLWSETSYRGWRLVTATDISGRIPARYETDLTNRIYGTLKKNDVYGTGSDVLEWTFAKPNGASRGVAQIKFDYTVTLPSGWRFRVDTYTWAFGSLSTVSTVISSATGSVQSGSVDLSFTAADRVDITVFNNSGSSFTNTSNTGDYSVLITGVRIKTETADSTKVVPNDVITDVLALAPAVSTTALSTSTLDIKDLVFEDVYPGDAIDRVTALGDASGNRWECGVDENRVLYYRQRGTASREWYADILDLDFARSMSEMWNSIYMVYKDYDGRTLRGTASTDTASTSLWGLTRSQAIKYDTTNITTANYLRDVALADRKNPALKTSLRVSPLGLPDLWYIRSGDYINIRNLPALSVGSLNFNRFRIERAEYDAGRDSLTLQSENPLTSLDFIIDRYGAGYNPRAQIIERDPRIIDDFQNSFNRGGVDPNTGLIPIRY